jgi:glycosyltransferase involved in cell wall biosynthesis
MSVIIIDPATGGVAGLYLDAYRAAAPDRDMILVGAHASVSADCLRYFYPRTDLASGGRQRFGRWRMPIRYGELIIGLLRCLVLIMRTRPKAVIYALSSNLVPELAFVTLLRLFRVPIYIVCHDVVPFVAAHENRTFKDWQRRQFYRLADRLICHNRRSMSELADNYGQSLAKLDYLPFPLVDMRPLQDDAADAGSPFPASATGTCFLFIGHVRAEKGADILVQAWHEAEAAGINATLVIAGQVPRGVELGDISALSRLTLIDQYIDEASYVSFVAASDIVVLPYVLGTNSGVLSNVLSLGKPAIVSDLPMFPESGLVPDDAYFAAGDVASLTAKLREVAADSAAERAERVHRVEAIRAARTTDFADALSALIDRIDAQ